MAGKLQGVCPECSNRRRSATSSTRPSTRRRCRSCGRRCSRRSTRSSSAGASRPSCSSSGIGGGGRSETANRLNEWMDPRHVHTHAFERRNDLERERPPAWRYWLALPPRGKIAHLPQRLVSRAARAADRGTDRRRRPAPAAAGDPPLRDDARRRGRAARQDLVPPRRATSSGERLKDLLDDPRTRWRVTDDDLAQLKTYNRYRDVAEHALRETSTSEAPWMIVEGGRSPVPRRRRRPDPPRGPARAASTSRSARPPGDRGAGRIARRQREAPARGGPLAQARPEGLPQAAREAAGAPRPPHAAQEVRQALDGDRVRGPGRGRQGLGDPPHHARARRAPIHGRADRGADRRGARPARTSGASGAGCRGHGHITIFDRSWYGRVLVERVEGLCAAADWMRAYREINDFEEQLAAQRHDRREVLAADQQGGAAPALQGARGRRPSSASRSRPRTGATARSGRPTRRRWPT